MVVIPENEPDEDEPLAENTRITNEIIDEIDPVWTEETDDAPTRDQETGREATDTTVPTALPTTTRRDRELRKLQTFFNPNPGDSPELEINDPEITDSQSGRDTQNNSEEENEKESEETDSHENTGTNEDIPDAENEKESDESNEPPEPFGMHDMAKMMIDYCDAGSITDLIFQTEEKQEIDDYEEPPNYDQAWNHQDGPQQKKWREAITKEFKDMKDRNVWTLIPRTQIPGDRRCVKCKWVFKVKRNKTDRIKTVSKAKKGLKNDFLETAVILIS
jgi:hypothetical protein